LEIKRATPSDATIISTLNATVQAVHAEALPHIFKSPKDTIFPPETIAAQLAEQQVVAFIAYDEDRPIGYLIAEILERPERWYRHAMRLLHIHHISVEPEHQGRGVGLALIERGKAYARIQGITHLELDVWVFNEKARGFFQKQGFTPYNVRMWLDLPTDAGGSSHRNRKENV
jgi:GNAT superfamily N-acetyltransferase